jgi:hypothetical protein
MLQSSRHFRRHFCHLRKFTTSTNKTATQIFLRNIPAAHFIRQNSTAQSQTASTGEGKKKFEFQAEIKNLLEIVAKSLYSDQEV